MLDAPSGALGPCPVLCFPSPSAPALPYLSFLNSTLMSSTLVSWWPNTPPVYLYSLPVYMPDSPTVPGAPGRNAAYFILVALHPALSRYSINIGCGMDKRRNEWGHSKLRPGEPDTTGGRRSRWHHKDQGPGHVGLGPNLHLQRSPDTKQPRPCTPAVTKLSANPPPR